MKYNCIFQGNIVDKKKGKRNKETKKQCSCQMTQCENHLTSSYSGWRDTSIRKEFAMIA